ncbi:bacteriocin-like protein [Chryseobacterium sp. SIMBA_028]|uniref:bacteriocin-like protein n=1 Tax=Chryseobacterium sp. SIMBA_028 TaxID=3085771 RepID=UPI003978E31F
MKNFKKISRNQLKQVKGSQKICPQGWKRMHCPNSPIPQCYSDQMTLECPDF